MTPAGCKYFLLFLLISNQSFSQKPIDINDTISIGGIRQYIRVKGKDDSKPILLFLHGEPGGSLLQKNDHINRQAATPFCSGSVGPTRTGLVELIRQKRHMLLILIN